MNMLVKSLIILLSLEATTYAQSFEILSSKGNIISFDTIRKFIPPNAELVHFDAQLINGYPGSKNVKVRRTNLDTIAGTQNYFCWVSCYSPTVNTDPGNNFISVNANDTSDTHFIGYYKPLGKSGTTRIRYAFYDIEGNVDSVSFVLELISTLPTNPIILQETDNFITNSDVTVAVEMDTVNNQINDMVYPLTIINNSNVIKQILVKKIVITEVTGSQNFFSWHATFNPTVMVDTAGYIMLPNTSITDEFKAIYRPNGNVGETVIQYIAFNKYDITDSSFVNVHFNVIYSGIESHDKNNSQLKAIPNPASSATTIYFEGSSIGKNSTLSLINLLGKEVANYSISVSQGQQKIETENLENGIYFCRLMNGSTVDKTIKIVVSK